MSSLDHKIKAVFFDLGYTLIFFDGDFSKVVEESYSILAHRLIEAGFPIDPVEFICKFNEKMQTYYRQREMDLIERPVEQFVTEILAELQIDHLPAAVARSAMNEMYLFTEKHWKIEKETHTVLKHLLDLDYKLGLITNASDAWDVNNLIDEHALRPYFETILISAAEGIRKPDAKIFAKAARQLGVELEETVMVGDTLNADILGAHNSGIKGIWIKRRKDALDTSALSNKRLIPDAEIYSLDELPAILDSWQS